MIFVENTKSNVTGMSNIFVKKGSAPKTVILRPGVNTVENDVWESMKQNELIKEKLEEGTLIVALEGKDADTVASNESLAALHYTQANKLIKATYDFELLHKWKATETRSAVLKSIDAQLKTFEIAEEQTEKFV